MPIKFKKQKLADETFESAGVMDVNGDGVPDIVSGSWWYEGPDFKKRHFIGEILTEGEYYDDFSTIALDVNGNGRPDFITGGFWGNTLRWRENPGDPKSEWPEHIIAEVGNVETTRAWDIDGDGNCEIIPNTPGGPLRIFKLNGNGAFKCHTIYNEAQGHGLGCGDIAGNGRMDIVLANGWLEAPPDPYQGKWQWHPEFNLRCVRLIVVGTEGYGWKTDLDRTSDRPG
jgi:hypothetical protein